MTIPDTSEKPMTELAYCDDVYNYSRLLTREVPAGNIKIGGLNPISIQSMTSTPTMDTRATVEQIIQLSNAGCEIVRLSTRNIREAENLKSIKAALKQNGLTVPLIADVHFNPRVAEVAAAVVEKVRINPGNYIDKKSDSKVKFSDADQVNALKIIKENLKPLIKICKEHGTALRIGSNHGSLSNRIISLYGDTPRGMVESALEFVRICEDLNFHNIVISMKASNVRVMVYATRLLVHTMMERGGDLYPIHLGVTEAGDGQEGRIKSAAGIGALLTDGIGDTLRVSLTEDPVNEIPVAKMLAERCNNYRHQTRMENPEYYPINPFDYTKRKTFPVNDIGGTNVPVVITSVNKTENSFPEGCDYRFSRKEKKIVACLKGTSDKSKRLIVPYHNMEEFLLKTESGEHTFIAVKPKDLKPESIEKIKNARQVVLVCEPDEVYGVHSLRGMMAKLINNSCLNPVVVKTGYQEADKDRFAINSAADYGFLMLDGLADGIWIEADKIKDPQWLTSVSLDILQACRERFSKTEYIACPSCGRTEFNIQQALSKIKKTTGHLRHLKIAVMGCIVNGPGEMADADYGYIGSGAGKITLYKGKTIIHKNIPEEKALDELIKIIKDNNDWAEPPAYST